MQNPHNAHPLISEMMFLNEIQCCNATCLPIVLEYTRKTEIIETVFNAIFSSKFEKYATHAYRSKTFVKKNILVQCFVAKKVYQN